MQKWKAVFSLELITEDSNIRINIPIIITLITEGVIFILSIMQSAPFLIEAPEKAADVWEFSCWFPSGALPVINSSPGKIISYFFCFCNTCCLNSVLHCTDVAL